MTASLKEAERNAPVNMDSSETSCRTYIYVNVLVTFVPLISTNKTM